MPRMHLRPDGILFLLQRINACDDREVTQLLRNFTIYRRFTDSGRWI